MMSDNSEKCWHSFQKKLNAIESIVCRQIGRRSTFADHVACRAKQELLRSFEQQDRPIDSIRADFLVSNAVRVEQVRQFVDTGVQIGSESQFDVAVQSGVRGGNLVAELLEESHLSQVDLKSLVRLLKHLGISRTSVANWCDVSVGYVSRTYSSSAEAMEISEFRFQVEKLLAMRLILRFQDRHLEVVPRRSQNGRKYISLLDCCEFVCAAPSRIHRVGVFSNSEFRSQDIIGEIRGQLICDTTYDSTTCFELSQYAKFEPERPFKYLNHSCQPNTEFFWQWEGQSELDEREVEGQPIVWLEAIRPIRTGEELTISYCWPDTFGTATCNCKSPRCTGKLGVTPD